MYKSVLLAINNDWLLSKTESMGLTTPKLIRVTYIAIDPTIEIRHVIIISIIKFYKSLIRIKEIGFQLIHQFSSQNQMQRQSLIILHIKVFSKGQILVKKIQIQSYNDSYLKLRRQITQLTVLIQIMTLNFKHILGIIRQILFFPFKLNKKQLIDRQIIQQVIVKYFFITIKRHVNIRSFQEFILNQKRIWKIASLAIFISQIPQQLQIYSQFIYQAYCDIKGIADYFRKLYSINIISKMKRGNAIIATVLASLLFYLAGSVSNFRYTFPYNYSAIDYSYTGNPAYIPVYDLGILQVGYSVTVRITYPNIGYIKQMDDQYQDLHLYFIYHLDPSTSFPIPALDSEGNIFVLPLPTTSSPPIYQFTYPIYFPPELQITSAQFKLVVNTDVDTYVDDALFDYFYVDVFYFKSQHEYSISNQNTMKNLLKVTESMRGSVLKVFYVSRPNSVFNITVFPQVVIDNDGFTDNNPWLFLYKINMPPDQRLTGNQWPLTYIPAKDTSYLSDEQIKAAGGTPVFTGNTAHYTIPFAEAGYYFLQVYMPHGGDIHYFSTVTFQSDPYICPYSSDYPDYYQNFQGCIQETSSNGLPCINYDSIRGVCNICIQNYILVNGTCLFNTTCKERQYFHFGDCLDVSPTCGSFDPFTGDCINCSDPNRYRLIGKECIIKSVNCSSRQWLSNFTCQLVSPSCDTFDPDTGSCLTCISKQYQLNINGKCTIIQTKCAAGQYAVGRDCVNIPSECQLFEVTSEKCLACIPGYFRQNGTCKRIQCPQGQIPSSIGVFCVNVSSLCSNYDYASGICFSCKDKNYIVNNGSCVQIVSPLAGCQERQRLGFGPCTKADLNCKIFNLINGDCQTCKDGYYKDFTGHCSPEAVCGDQQWSVNGQCLKIQQNCNKVDSLGLCIECISIDFRIILGQCVYFKKCQDHQYLSSGNQCVDVSPNCATWNPSNGQCIACKESRMGPVSGVCCAFGQVYSLGKCINSNSLQKDGSIDTCLIQHPTLRICLKCNEGFSPDYTIPFKCIQS